MVFCSNVRTQKAQIYTFLTGRSHHYWILDDNPLTYACPSFRRYHRLIISLSLQNVSSQILKSRTWARMYKTDRYYSLFNIEAFKGKSSSFLKERDLVAFDSIDPSCLVDVSYYELLFRSFRTTESFLNYTYN